MIKVYEGDDPFLFISYSHTDEKAVFYCDYLRRNKCRIWYDEGNHGGDDWSETIASHLLKANRVLYLISENSLKSKYVTAEITMALSHHIPIIPIKIEDVNLSPGMELKIGHLHFVNLFEAESIREECEKLSNEIPRELYDFTGNPFFHNDKYSFYVMVEELKEWDIGPERKMKVVAVSEKDNKTIELYSYFTDPATDPFYKVLGVDKAENGYFDEKGNETLVVQILCTFDVEYPMYGNRIEALFSIAIVNPLGDDVKGVPIGYKIISPKTGIYEPDKTIDVLTDEAKYYERCIVNHISKFFYGDPRENKKS